MLTSLRRRRSPRPVILTERGQMVAGLLILLAGLFWLCAAAKGV